MKSDLSCFSMSQTCFSALSHRRQLQGGDVIHRRPARAAAAGRAAHPAKPKLQVRGRGGRRGRLPADAGPPGAVCALYHISCLSLVVGTPRCHGWPLQERLRARVLLRWLHACRAGSHSIGRVLVNMNMFGERMHIWLRAGLSPISDPGTVSAVPLTPRLPDVMLPCLYLLPSISVTCTQVQQPAMRKMIPLNLDPALTTTPL